MSNAYQTIELSPLDAEYYIQFQKHYQNIRALLDEKVFELKGGKVILDIDLSGMIKKIEKRSFAYPHNIKRYNWQKRIFSNIIKLE